MASLLWLPSTLLRLANNYFGTDISNYDEEYQTATRSKTKSSNDTNRSISSLYIDFGEDLSFTSHYSQIDQGGRHDELYERIQMLIAEDQIEHFLMENQQARKEKDEEIEELRAMIGIMEDRYKRRNSNQNERLRIRDDELRKYRKRIRELLALVGIIRSNKMDPDAVASMKNKIKELAEENFALREANKKLSVDITKLTTLQLMKCQQNQEKILSPTQVLPWIRHLLNHFDYKPRQSFHLPEQKEADGTESRAATADAGGDHEWTLQEAEARELMLARQSSSEEILASSRCTTPIELTTPAELLPPPSPISRFGDLDDIASDDAELAFEDVTDFQLHKGDEEHSGLTSELD